MKLCQSLSNCLFDYWNGGRTNDGDGGGDGDGIVAFITVYSYKINNERKKITRETINESVTHTKKQGLLGQLSEEILKHFFLSLRINHLSFVTYIY